MHTRMLWHKAWLDTRWRFWVGLFVVVLAACGVVLSYPRALVVANALEQSPGVVLGAGPAATRVEEALSLVRMYPAYVSSQLYQQELPQLWCLFAMVIGAGGIVSQAARSGGLFTLALPVSRLEIVTARAGVGLFELLVIALAPAVVVPALSPVVGQSYHVSDGLVHAALLFGGGAVFFCFTFLMSSIFSDVWRPPLLMAAVFFSIAALRSIVPRFTSFTLAPVITGASYFQTGSIPWTALLLSMLTSLVFLWLAARNVARRDF